MQVFFFSFCAIFRSRQIARFYYFLTSFPYNTFFILQNQPEKGLCRPHPARPAGPALPRIFNGETPSLARAKGLFPSGGFHRARAGRWRGKFAII